MTVRVTMDVAGRHVDQILTGTDAEDILAQAKARVAQALGWKGLFLNVMSPLAFAQEAVRRYNSAFSAQLPVPQSADEFLKQGQTIGYVHVLPDTPATP